MSSQVSWTARPLARRNLPLTAGVLLAGGLAALSLCQPYGWDQGIMAAIGDVMVKGGVPYRDGWDLKGPLSFAVFALAQVLFGPTMWGVRVLELVILALALVALHQALAAWTTPRIAAWGAIALFVFWQSVGWFFTAQPDLWAGAMAGMAVCLFLKPGDAPSPGRVVAAGLLIGAAGLVKPFYLCIGAAPLVAVMAASLLTWPRRLILAVVLGLAAAAPIAAATLYFAAHGALWEAIDVHLLYGLRVYAGGPTAGLCNILTSMGEFASLGPVALLAPFAALGAWTMRRDPRNGAVLLVWLGSTLFCVVLQAKFYVYQWLPVYGPLVFAAAVGLHGLRRSAAAEAKAASGAVVAMFLALTAAGPLTEAATLAKLLLTAPDPWQAYYDRHGEWLYVAGNDLRAVRYIQRHTAPDETIFVWGNDSILYPLSQRRNPTRFTVNMPLAAEGPYRARYQAEAMRDLQANRPAYIVIGLPFETDDKVASVARFPAFQAFLSQGYVLETRIGVLDVYRRRP